MLEQFRGSLTRVTLLKMALRIALVVIMVTGVSYYHLVNVLEVEKLGELEKYVTERGQRESAIFALAEDNLNIFKQDLVERLQLMGAYDPQAEFAAMFEAKADGTTRLKAEFFEGGEVVNGATVKGITAFIGRNTVIDADLRRYLVVVKEMLAGYGPAWQNRFIDIYITTPQNVIMVYWPDGAWGLDAAADLDITKDEYVYLADKVHNPKREVVWTGSYYDPVSDLWLISAELPLDVDGQHVLTVGQDMTLNQLLERTVNNTLNQGENIIFTAEGRLVAHSAKLAEIQAGQVDIQTGSDDHLKRIYELVRAKRPEQVLIDNQVDGEYLAVAQISGPDWYFVLTFPKQNLQRIAFDNARVVLLLGAMSLLLEVLLLFMVLRQQVAQPLNRLMQATTQVAAGNFVVELETRRPDELGQLARLFEDMARRLREAFALLEQRVVERTEELQRANEKLAVSNANKDKFFSIVAHDLKGPFLPLLGNLELMTEMAEGLKPKDVQEMSAASYRSARRVFELLENLLHWARLQMGRMEYQPEPLSLYEVAQQTVNVLGEVAEAKGIRLLNEVAPEVMVYADGNMLDTVIRNLTNNALKFTAAGGQVRIESRELGVRSQELGIGREELGIRDEELGVRGQELGIGEEELGIRNEVTPNSQFPIPNNSQLPIPNSSLPMPNYIEVSIADTGVGISEEVRQKLFKLDEHITTVGTGKETGTGLGLIICQEMVVKNGGRIWVESALGQGTTVRFTVRANE